MASASRGDSSPEASSTTTSAPAMSASNVTGILAGSPVQLSPGDLERVWTQVESDAEDAR